LNKFGDLTPINDSYPIGCCKWTSSRVAGYPRFDHWKLQRWKLSCISPGTQVGSYSGSKWKTSSFFLSIIVTNSV